MALGVFALTSCGFGGTTSGGCALMSCGVVGPRPLTVFAAASLQPSFDKIATEVKARYQISPTFNYAGTQTLAAQLTDGAQADVFASADMAHMTTIQNAGLIAGAPPDLSRSGLVVVLADPSVPAGKYAQQALTKAGVTIKPASLELQVTAVLTKVALGEADAGIVYVSDVVTSGKVDGVAIPDGQNVVADYPIAALKNAQHNSTADAFIAFVLAPDGQSILKAAGFEPA
ncbi:MAG: molybdate ABC transporter substrate-binding protein [Chloroflexi bacterium]|nr:MAG: molybdate ABC transporter substrate-binding protein [Chloroflexota bacterium]